MDVQSYSVDITAENFQTDVVEKSQQVPVLLEFYAEGAQQCLSTSAILRKLAVEYQGKFQLGRIDVQSNPQLVQQLSVRTLPTIKIVFQGQMSGEMEGEVNEEQLKGALDQLTMSPFERIREQLDLLISAGNRPQAIAMLQELINDEPKNYVLHVELADLLIMQEQVDDAKLILAGLPQDTPGIEKPKNRIGFIEQASSLESLDKLQSALAANPDDLQGQFDLAIRLVVEDQIEPALDMLLAIMQADKTWDEEAARITMIKVFNMLGKGNGTATSYRRKMFTFLH